MEKNFLATTDFSVEKIFELYMTYSLSGRIYAIPAQQISEIVQLPELSVLERLPDYIVGVMNLRGRIINVIDLRMILGIPRYPFSTDNQVLIVNVSGKTFGIVVDSVKDVIQFNRDYLEPLPYKSREKHISGIYKADDELVAFIDLDTIIQDIYAEDVQEDLMGAGTALTALDMFPNDKLSVEKFKKRAINLKKEIKVYDEQIDYTNNRFVSFSLNGEIYCIGLKYVKEFCKLKLLNIVPVPCVPEFILGIFNHRGDFITVIDIKAFLKIPRSQVTDRTKVIVVRYSELQIGLVVDDVFDILSITSDKLCANVKSKFEHNKFVCAEFLPDSGEVMNVLDLEKFLEDERLIIEDAI